MNSEYHCIKPLLWACSNTLYTSYIGSWDLLMTINDAKQVDETNIPVPSPRPLEATAMINMLYVSFIRMSVQRLELESGYLLLLLNSGLALCFTNDNRPNTSGLSVSKNHQETRAIYFEKLFVSSQGTWVNTPLLRYIMVKVKMNLVSA